MHAASGVLVVLAMCWLIGSSRFSMNVYSADSVPEAVQAANGQLVHVSGASYEERVLRYMHYMAKNAGETQKILQSMDER